METQKIAENEAFVPLISTSLPMTLDCVSDIREIISRARQNVVRQVNLPMTLAYWLIGRRIVVEGQKGKCAAYGELLLHRLSRELTADFGKGFAAPKLRNCRLFYQTYSSEEAIRYALRIKLSRTHHRVIMWVGDPKACEFYLRVRQLRYCLARRLTRQVSSSRLWRNASRCSQKSSCYTCQPRKIRSLKLSVREHGHRLQIRQFFHEHTDERNVQMSVTRLRP